MATFSRKVLAFGQLPSTKGDLYDPTTSATGLVHNMTIHNTNVSSETVQLYYHNGTNEYRIFNIVVTAGDTAVLDFGNEGFIVDATGKITGSTTTASKVTFKFDGSEETA